MNNLLEALDPGEVVVWKDDDLGWIVAWNGGNTFNLYDASGDNFDCFMWDRDFNRDTPFGQSVGEAIRFAREHMWSTADPIVLAWENDDWNDLIVALGGDYEDAEDLFREVNDFDDDPIYRAATVYGSNVHPRCHLIQYKSGGPIFICDTLDQPYPTLAEQRATLERLTGFNQ